MRAPSGGFKSTPQLYRDSLRLVRHLAGNVSRSGGAGGAGVG
jgi:hypothetical protein